MTSARTSIQMGPNTNPRRDTEEVICNNYKLALMSGYIKDLSITCEYILDNGLPQTLREPHTTIYGKIQYIGSL